MQDKIVFMDVKESHEKPQLLFDITMPQSMIAIEKAVFEDGSDNIISREVLEGIHIYVQPSIRRIEFYIIHHNKEWYESGEYYNSLNIENYNQFPVNPLIIEEDAWRVKILGDMHSQIYFNEELIRSITSDTETCKKWIDTTEKNNELQITVLKPGSVTVISNYGPEYGPKNVINPDIVNVYCDREMYLIRVEAIKNGNVVFKHLVKIRTLCILKGFRKYPQTNMVFSTEDRKWLCMIQGAKNSNISIESDYLRKTLEVVNEMDKKIELERKKQAKKAAMRLLDIIDGKYHPKRPQKIVRFEKPESIFIFPEYGENNDMEIQEYIDEAEVHFSEEIYTIILFIKRGMLPPGIYRFPCKEWNILWDTDDFSHTEEYIFCSEKEPLFTISCGKKTKMQTFMDISARIETAPKK